MTNLTDKCRQNYLWIVIVIAVLTFVPFLGETLFNTKGEPREAIVAVSMLQQGDWILPESCGGDIPYKPPFFAWCIAAVSMLFGGEVTEFTSRLPSAVAMIVMVVTGFCFFRRRTSDDVAMVMSMVTMTAFEVHRAATMCRVDMVLTMFIVTSLYALFIHHEKGAKGLPWLAILLMSGGVLTKGPIAMGLPCLVAGVYRLLRGDGFWRVFGSLAGAGILACVLPAVWYIAAYGKGGEEFLALALEENVGRLAGTMSYESHVNPWYYNVITVIAGLAPFTLLLLMAATMWRPAGRIVAWKNRCKYSWAQLREKLRTIDAVKLFSFLSVALIFVFYCIPKSKRSVYLLPIYPFLAYFITLLIMRLARKGAWPMRVYAIFISSVALIVALAMTLIKCNVVPLTMFGEKNAVFIGALEQLELSPMTIALYLLLIAAGVVTLMAVKKHMHLKTMVLTLIITLVIYWNFSAYLQPAVLNAKSDYKIALEIGKLVPTGNVYSFIDNAALRCYTINFYLGDRVKLFDKDLPLNGLLIVGEKDNRVLQDKFGSRYNFEVVAETGVKSCDLRQNIILLKFKHVPDNE